MRRRHLVAGAAALIGSAAAPYPDRPVRILSSAPPGGASDVVARLVADGLQTGLGGRFVVENRVGAGGAVAAEAAARAPADGHTLFMGILSTQVLLPAIRRVPYDAEAGFAPIGLVSAAPMVLVVHPALPVRSVAELVALSRERPGLLNFSNGGIATLPHLLHEMLAREAGLVAQAVPYSGSATSLQAVIAGETAATFEVGVIIRGQVANGALRALAVTTPERDPGFPGVPTMAELGLPRLRASSWAGLLAPAGTPDAIIRSLSGRLAALAVTDAFRARLAALGAAAAGSSPEEFAAFLVAERARWADLARGFASALAPGN
jgi:tripartite-type tricarboxylate transporter receptor subunit TctC